MGQLFNRIGHVVRVELNATSNQGHYKENYLNEGNALVAGGAVTGASIGKVGLLAGGTGYSLGAIPLAALGALTGAALYEALRSLLEDDGSSASAAVIGATVGAATSAAIGGVGVAVGGSAIGVGLASMAAGGAVAGLGLVGLNRLLQHGVDPEKLLDLAINQMEIDVLSARQSLINLIVSGKRLQQQYEQVQAEVDKWEKRTQLALRKGDEDLAREALNRKKIHSDVLSSLKANLDQALPVENFKQNLTLLEAEIAEAKMMRTQLKAQLVAAKVNRQLQSSAMAVFERMEDKMLQLEAGSQTAELADAELESQFRALVSSDVDWELEAMKQEMLAHPSAPQQSLRGRLRSNN
jgi:phage shock protein A